MLEIENPWGNQLTLVYLEKGLTKRCRADGPNDGSVWPDHPSSGPSARRLL